MSARRDVFEANLRRLFERAYAPVEPRPEFVVELAGRFADGVCTGAGESSTPRVPVGGRRWLAAAAIATLAVGAAWTLLGRGDGASRDHVARLRTAPGGAWVEHDPTGVPQRFVVDTDWLEVRTGSIPVELASAAAQFTAAPRTELAIDRQARSLELRHGTVDLDVRGGPVWTVATAAGEVVPVGRARVELVPRAAFLESTRTDDPWRSPAALAAIARTDAALSGRAPSGAPGAPGAPGALGAHVGLVSAPESVRSSAGTPGLADDVIFDGRALLYRGRLVHRFPEADGPDDGGRVAVAGGGLERTPVGPLDGDGSEAGPGAGDGQVVLRGSVRDAETGAPLDAFDVVLLEARNLPDPGFPVARAFQDAGGRFAWSDVAPGRYRVQVRAAGYAPWFALSHEIPADAVGSGDSTSVLDVALGRGATVRGRVVDAATGEPVSGAEVLSETDAAFRVLPLGTLGDLPSLSGVAVTDARGRFELAHTTGGTQVLRACHPDHGAGWVRLAQPGQSAEIALPRAGSITGHVTGPDGTALVASRVVASYVGHLDPCLSFGTALTDADGRYRIDGLPPGSYALIHAGPDDAEAAADFEPRTAFVAVGGGQEVEQGFGPQRPSTVGGPGADGRVEVAGTVLTADGAPFARASVSFVRIDDVVGSWERSFESVTTDATGRFTIELAPGSYAVFTARDTAQDMAWTGRVEPSSESPGETLGLRFQRAGGRLFGRVTGPEGEAVTGAMLALERLDGLPDARLRTSGRFAGRAAVRRDGAYAVAGLQEGRYLVTVYDPTGRCAYTRFELDIDPEAADIDPEVADGERHVALAAGRSVTFVFSDPAGAPLADVGIQVVDGDGRDIYGDDGVLSDSEGALRLLGLPRGTFHVSARLSGFTPAAVDVTFVDELELSRTVVLQPR